MPGNYKFIKVLNNLVTFCDRLQKNIHIQAASFHILDLLSCYTVATQSHSRNHFGCTKLQGQDDMIANIFSKIVGAAEINLFQFF